MWSWRCRTTRSISCLYFFRFKVSSKRLSFIFSRNTGHQDPNTFYAYGSFSTGHTVLAKSELISPKTRDAPWKQVIDCQFSEQTPAPPFSPPAAHKIVNCLGKQARGNLGVERHKSQRENYGTLLICSWSDGVNEILEDHSALNLFERSFKRLICSSDGMCLQYSVR